MLPKLGFHSEYISTLRELGEPDSNLEKKLEVIKKEGRNTFSVKESAKCGIPVLDIWGDSEHPSPELWLNAFREGYTDVCEWVVKNRSTLPAQAPLTLSDHTQDDEAFMIWILKTPESEHETRGVEKGYAAEGIIRNIFTYSKTRCLERLLGEEGKLLGERALRFLRNFPSVWSICQGVIHKVSFLSKILEDKEIGYVEVDIESILLRCLAQGNIPVVEYILTRSKPNNTTYNSLIRKCRSLEMYKALERLGVSSVMYTPEIAERDPELMCYIIRKVQSLPNGNQDYGVHLAARAMETGNLDVSESILNTMTLEQKLKVLRYGKDTSSPVYMLGLKVLLKSLGGEGAEEVEHTFGNMMHCAEYPRVLILAYEARAIPMFSFRILGKILYNVEFCMFERIWKKIEEEPCTEVDSLGFTARGRLRLSLLGEARRRGREDIESYLKKRPLN